MAHVILKASEIVAGMVIVGTAGKVGYEYPTLRSDGLSFLTLGNFPCSVRESDNYGSFWRSNVHFMPWECSNGTRNATYADHDDLYIVETGNSDSEEGAVERHN
jgi:hypothetical protein